jgi:hypothetical protein
LTKVYNKLILESYEGRTNDYAARNEVKFKGEQAVPYGNSSGLSFGLRHLAFFLSK